MSNLHLSKWLAECFGTFALVFAGTGAIIVNSLSNDSISHVGVSLTFGLVVLAMIYAIGNVSGAHLNPAVTLAFYIAQRFPGKLVVPYVLSQLLGAILASLTLRTMFPDSLTLGETLPIGSFLQAFELEFVLSFILMFVILSVSTGSKEQGLMAGVAIGSVIAFEALLGGPISGASMNPARSLAPALVMLRFKGLSIYLVAPVLGACASVWLHHAIHVSNSQPTSQEPPE